METNCVGACNEKAHTSRTKIPTGKERKLSLSSYCYFVFTAVS